MTHTNEELYSIIDRYKAEHEIHLNSYDTTSLLLFAGWLLQQNFSKPDVSGPNEQLKSKFHIGQRVKVCGDLETTITRIEGEKYYFLDTDGKEWSEVESAIETI